MAAPSEPEVEGALWRPSANFGARRDGLRPSLIVLHHTAMHSAEAALARLCDAGAEAPVSCHYVIAEDGRVWQLVREADRAWHAGLGQWGGLGDVNSRSIGIELANPAPNPFAEPQMARLESLLSQLLDRWAIAPERVIGHSDMAPGRKADPGPKFDWRRLARQGLSVWPEAPGPEGEEVPLLQSLARFGYPVEDPEPVREAFRMRFRPWALGRAEEPDDRRVAAALAARWPWVG